MARWFSRPHPSPIGVDVGSRCVKLLQFSGDFSSVRDVVRWDFSLPRDADQAARHSQIVQALRHAREGRNFRGRDAVFCIHSNDLFVQNVRVPKAPGAEFERLVCAEAAGRLPFPSDEAELRYVEAGDVRHGDATRREVILLASHRPCIQRIVGTAEAAGLRPLVIDVEPEAILRCYWRQFRREEDRNRSLMLVNVGTASSKVVIARNAVPMFVKYIDVAGDQMDAAVARHLEIGLPEATALRRHNGDRRADQRDAEVTRGIDESLRPILDRLANEISMCARYYSVTFRGQPIDRMILSGGEASEALLQWIGRRLDIECELGDPLRAFETPAVSGRPGQWDVAAGLALRQAT